MSSSGNQRSCELMSRTASHVDAAWKIASTSPPILSSEEKIASTSPPVLSSEENFQGAGPGRCPACEHSSVVYAQHFMQIGVSTVTATCRWK